MWSRKYSCCEACATVERPHMAKGLCRRCYLARYNEQPENAAKALEHKRRWYKANVTPELQKEKREALHFDSVRAKVLPRDGNKCCRCPATTGLVVHHKDENGRGCAEPNNDEENLETLCRACHAKHHSTNKAWSRAGDLCCRDCKRSDRKHNARGLCWSCYLARQPKAPRNVP